MAKRITTKALDEGFDSVIKKAKTFLGVIDTSLEGIKNMSAILKKRKGGLDLGNAKDLEKFNKLYKQSGELVKRRTDADKEAAKLRKQLNDLDDEAVKGSLRFQKAKRDQKKLLEAELILEQKSIRSKQDLQDRIKALRIQGQNLDLGSDELRANNEEIDRLTERLSENSDQFIKNKINIGNYKSATEGLTKSFDDQKKRLVLLTDAYANAVAQGDKNTRQARKLKKELEDQKEALKDVKEATEDTASATKKLGTAAKAIGIGLFFALLAKIGDLFGTSREGSLETEKAIANLTESIKVFFSAIVNSFEGVKEIFKSLIDSIKSGINSAKIIFFEFQLSIQKTTNVLGSNNDKIKELQATISGLKKKQEELDKSTNSVASGYDKIKEAFNDFGETTVNAVSSQQKFLELQLATEISIERQTRALAGLQEQRQILQDISDDDTLGFETRALAVKKAEEAAISFAKQETKLLLTKEKLAIEAVKQDLFVSKALSKSRLDQIKTGEQLNALLRRRGIAIKVSSENEAAFTEAFTERIDKQVEAQAFERDQEEKFRKTFRDSYEQRADILEEFSEKQFAINDAIINDETKSQEERFLAFKKNQILSQQLINETTALTLEQARNSIDLNNNLSAQQKAEAKAKLDLLNINELVSEQDAQIVFDKIRALDLGEIEEKRLKEAIKIRKDLLEQQKEEAKVLAESTTANTNLKDDIIAQEKLLNDETIKTEEDLNRALEQLEKDRFDNTIERLRSEIDALDDNSNEKLEKQKELNDLLIEEEKRRLSKEEEARKAAADKRAETEEFIRKQSVATTVAVLDGFVKQSQARQASIQEDISQATERKNQLLALTASTDSQTSQLAADSLAEQRQIEEEKTRQLEIEKQKQVRLELLIAAVKSYGNNAGQPNAAAKTIADLGILIAGASAAAGSFYEGTDRLGKVDNPTDSKGGRLIEAHEDEMIIQPGLVRKMGFPKRADVADVFTRYKEGKLIDKKGASNQLQQIILNNDNSAVVSELKALKQEIRNSSNAKVILDTQKNLLKLQERKGNRTNIYAE